MDSWLCWRHRSINGQLAVLSQESGLALYAYFMGTWMQMLMVSFRFCYLRYFTLVFEAGSPIDP